MLDSRRLLVLDAVARAGSLTRAAEELGYTPSAISQQISALEAQAGAPLVERVPRGVRLTEVGRVLAGHAAALRARLQAADEELRELLDVRAGRLRLGAFPSAGAHLLPAAIARFRASHPGVTVTMDAVEPADAPGALREARLDLAIVFGYDFAPVYDAAGLEAVELLDDVMHVALPAEHPLAGEDEVALRSLREETWVQSADPTCALLLTHSAHRARFEPAIGFHSDDYAAVLRLVAAGVGVALVPSLVDAVPPPGAVLRPLRPAPARSVSALLAPSPSPAARAMLDLLAEQAATVGAQARPPARA